MAHEWSQSTQPQGQWAHQNVPENLLASVRPSRASSIISTHTQASITTLEEPAIDIDLGRECFRIGREGSILDITRNEVPAPPYDAPFVPISSISPESSRRPTSGGESVGIFNCTINAPAASYSPLPSPEDVRRDQLAYPVQPGLRDVGRTTSDSTPSARNHSDSTPTSPGEATGVSRSPSYRPGQENLSVNRRRTPSSGASSEQSVGPGKGELRRRNGVRLKLVTRTSTDSTGQNESRLTPLSALSSNSARSGTTYSGATTPIRADARLEPDSPTYIGKKAFGLFPCPKTKSASSLRTPSPQLKLVAQSPPYIDDGLIGADPPPSMDTEDEIKIHYNRLLRTIDRNYRAELHARDEEMSKLRQRINEMDIVYRKELRARDQEMENRLHARDRELNELLERTRRLEVRDQDAADKARHEIEDLWEMRWKDRDRHLRERMARLEAEHRANVKRAVAENNAKWLDEWSKRETELLGDLGDLPGGNDQVTCPQNMTEGIASTALPRGWRSCLLLQDGRTGLARLNSGSFLSNEA